MEDFQCRRKFGALEPGWEGAVLSSAGGNTDGSSSPNGFSWFAIRASRSALPGFGTVGNVCLPLRREFGRAKRLGAFAKQSRWRDSVTERPRQLERKTKTLASTGPAIRTVTADKSLWKGCWKICPRASQFIRYNATTRINTRDSSLCHALQIRYVAEIRQYGLSFPLLSIGGVRYGHSSLTCFSSTT